MAKNKEKKLALKSHWAFLELSDVEEQMEEYLKAFHEHFKEENEYYQYLNQPDISEPAGEVDGGECSTSDEEEQPQSKANVPAEIHHLYKSIARKTHPDICDNKAYHELFKLAAKAAKEGNLTDLLHIASKLDIDIPTFSDETVELVEKNIESKLKKAAEIKTSTAWVWGTCEQDVAANRELMLRTMGIDPEKFAEWKRKKKR